MVDRNLLVPGDPNLDEFGMYCLFALFGCGVFLTLQKVMEGYVHKTFLGEGVLSNTCWFYLVLLY